MADTWQAVSKKPAWRIHLVVLGTALVAGVGLSLFMVKTGDLPIYVRAAERMLRGEAIYRADEGGGWTYPPFFAVPVIPLVFLAPAAQRTVWLAANLTLLMASLYVLRRWLIKLWPPGATQPRSEIRFWLVTLATSVMFFIAPIEGRTHDLFILFCVMLTVDALCADKSGWAGVWAGLGAACKATPLLFGLVFLWQGRFRACATMTLTLAVATLLPDLLCPQASGPIWVKSWVDTFLAPLEAAMPAQANGAWIAWNPLNQSLAGTVHRLATPVPAERAHPWDYWDASVIELTEQQQKGVILAAQLAVILVLLAVTWRRSRPSDGPDGWLRTLAQGVVVACAMVLLSPMSSKPHFCTLVIPLTAVWMCHLHRRRDLLLVGIASTASVLGWLQCQDLGLGFIANPLCGYGGHTFAAIAAFASSAYLAVRYARFARRDQAPYVELRKAA